MATIVHRCSPPSTLAFLSISILLTLPLASPIASTDLLPVTRTGGKYDCFSDNECSLGKFCNRSELEGLMEFGECIPLVKENAECISSYGGDWWIWTEETDGPYKFHNCQAGLYCDSKYKCRPTAGVGKSCDDEVYNSCEAGTYCDGKSKKCIKQVGLAAACGTSDLKNPQCLDSAGLYCKKPELSADTGICARKLTGGKTSDPHGDGCYGFEIEVGKDAKKVCMPRRLKGQFCRWNSQCDGERRPGSMRKDTVCNWVNKRTGYLPRYGVCAKERDLLRTAGAVCTPGMDLCDARRDLRCEKRGGKHVCVQKGGFNPHAASHCTPNSEFSECPGQECRRVSGMITTSPHGPFLCLRKIERLAQGEICSLFEHTHCKKGLKCVKAEGIRTKDGDQPLGYCMQQIGEGKNCTEWHRVACTEGTFCIADADAEMKCTKSTTKPRVVASFSGYQISCKSRDCAPGLVCVDDECQLPQKESKLRAVCGQTSPAFKVRIASATNRLPLDTSSNFSVFFP